MIRRLALIMCVVLLLLAVVAWALSYTTWGRMSLQPRPVITFTRDNDEVWLSTGISDQQISFEVEAASPVMQSGPMRYYAVSSARGVRVPLWLVCAGFAVACVFMACLGRRSRRRHRLASGCCIRCGYNLTGNVSGVCPECGERIRPPGREVISQ